MVVLGDHNVISVVIPAVGIDIGAVDKNVNGGHFTGEHDGRGDQFLFGKPVGDTDDSASLYVSESKVRQGGVLQRNIPIENRPAFIKLDDLGPLGLGQKSASKSKKYDGHDKCQYWKQHQFSLELLFFHEFTKRYNDTYSIILYNIFGNNENWSGFKMVTFWAFGLRAHPRAYSPSPAHRGQ